MSRPMIIARVNTSTKELWQCRVLHSIDIYSSHSENITRIVSNKNRWEAVELDAYTTLLPQEVLVYEC